MNDPQKIAPEELHDQFKSLSSQLFKVYKELQRLEPHTKYNMDKKAIDDIMGDLFWAIENCTVIASHQVGKALYDNMGTGLRD